MTGSPIVGRVGRDASTAEFLDGTASGVLLLQECLRCGGIDEPQSGQCGRCGSTERRRRPAAGRATVVSWSVLHSRSEEGIVRIPIAIGELEEGPWWWS